MGLAAHGDALDIGILIGGSGSVDDEFGLRVILRVEVDGHLVEYGRGEGIYGQARRIGIDAYHCKDGPSRHGACVVVAREAVGLGGEMLGQEVARQSLCAPLLSLDLREDVGIADVGLVGRVVVSLVENILEALQETLLAAPEFHHARHVVGHGKGVVPGRTFVESGTGFEIFALEGIERAEELATGRDGAERAGLGTVVFFVALRTVAQGFCIFLVA